VLQIDDPSASLCETGLPQVIVPQQESARVKGFLSLAKMMHGKRKKRDDLAGAVSSSNNLVCSMLMTLGLLGSSGIMLPKDCVLFSSTKSLESHKLWQN